MNFTLFPTAYSIRGVIYKCGAHSKNRTYNLFLTIDELSREFSLIILHSSILQNRCTGIVQNIYQFNSNLINIYAEIYFLKVKV